MQQITDWKALWKSLVEIKQESRLRSIETPAGGDIWQIKAREFDVRVKQRWQKPDTSRETVLSYLTSDSTILDIGAGTGAWAMLFAQHVHQVTAVEPSPAMRGILLENLREGGCANVRVLETPWPETEVSKHDYSFCSHAMYGVGDFQGFVQHMLDHTRKRVFLLIRAPWQDGLITEAFNHVWGQPHDSPNFIIAYNILLGMGITPDVKFEHSRQKTFLISASLDEAFSELKSRLGLTHDPSYDAYMRDLLERRLLAKDGQYLWPGSCESALIHWDVHLLND